MFVLCIPLHVSRFIEHSLQLRRLEGIKPIWLSLNSMRWELGILSILLYIEMDVHGANKFRRRQPRL